MNHAWWWVVVWGGWGGPCLPVDADGGQKLTLPSAQSANRNLPDENRGSLRGRLFEGCCQLYAMDKNRNRLQYDAQNDRMDVCSCEK